MIVSETIFVNRQPVGMVRMDSNSGLIGFSPITGQLLIQDRNWSSVDELRVAVMEAYSETTKDGPLR